MPSEILVSITGNNFKEAESKILEANFFKLKKVALFLSRLTKKDRIKVYELLLDSSIKEIPLVHARHDMDLIEYKFLQKEFNVKYFNLHDDISKIINKKKLNSISKKLLLELGFMNHNMKKISLSTLKGFCIDLSHFKSSEERCSSEFEFALKYKNKKSMFVANHLSGHNLKEKICIRKIHSRKEFHYLETLPNFVFGKIIALEVCNPIKEQLEFRTYLQNFLKRKIKLKK